MSDSDSVDSPARSPSVSAGSLEEVRSRGGSPDDELEEIGSASHSNSGSLAKSPSASPRSDSGEHNEALKGNGKASVELDEKEENKRNENGESKEQKDDDESKSIDDDEGEHTKSSNEKSGEEKKSLDGKDDDETKTGGGDSDDEEKRNSDGEEEKKFVGDDDDDNEPGPSKRRRVVMSSDDEDNDSKSPRAKRESSESGDEHEEVGVGELMTNIFGEESDEEKEQESERHEESTARREEDEDEPRYVREEEEVDDGRVWDFDEIMMQKKLERRKHRRRRRDGSIDIGGDADDQIKMLIDAMKAAAKDDRHSNMERKPALQKRKMLPYVKATLIKHDLMEAIIDNGMMNVVSEWLAPLPDKSLPALEIRTDLLKILQDYKHLEPGTLKQSGLGRAVMLLYKHPRETKENKMMAQRLISDWARPIFQLDTDFRSMTREERVQRDYAQLPEAKKLKLSQAQALAENADPHEVAAAAKEKEREKEKQPGVGEKGFINRARVPRPSQKDYVVRPKSNVEGQFRGATKNRHNSRFDRTQRDFKERTRQCKAMRAIGVSIEGRKMDI